MEALQTGRPHRRADHSDIRTPRGDPLTRSALAASRARNVVYDTNGNSADRSWHGASSSGMATGTSGTARANRGYCRRVLSAGYPRIGTRPRQFASGNRDYRRRVTSPRCFQNSDQSERTNLNGGSIRYAKATSTSQRSGSQDAATLRAGRRYAQPRAVGRVRRRHTSATNRRRSCARPERRSAPRFRRAGHSW